MSLLARLCFQFWCSMTKPGSFLRNSKRFWDMALVLQVVRSQVSTRLDLLIGGEVVLKADHLEVMDSLEQLLGVFCEDSMLERVQLQASKRWSALVKRLTADQVIHSVPTQRQWQPGVYRKQLHDCEWSTHACYDCMYFDRFIGVQCCSCAE